MSLLYSVLFFSLGITLARLTYIGTRLPRRPWWTKEGITTFLIIVVVGMLSFGIAFLVDTVLGWERQVFGKAELVAVIGFIMTAVVLWVAMGNLPRGAEPGPVVAMPRTGPAPETPDGGVSPRPVPSTSGRPRKAA